jgi:hypothetical protein
MDVRSQPYSRHVLYFNRERAHLLVGGETGFGRLEREAEAVALKE